MISVNEKFRDGDPSISQKAIHHIFIDSDRRSEDSCPDIGNIREIEQSLDRPIFSVRPMKNRENHIHFLTSGIFSLKTENPL